MSGCCSKGACTDEVHIGHDQVGQTNKVAPDTKSCEAKAKSCCDAGECGAECAPKPEQKQSCCAAGTCGSQAKADEGSGQKNVTPLDIVIFLLQSNPEKQAAFVAASVEEREKMVEVMTQKVTAVFVEAEKTGQNVDISKIEIQRGQGT